MTWTTSGMVRTAGEIRDIIRVCRGDKPADLVIRNGTLVNVYSGEVYKADVAVCGERIASVGCLAHVAIGDSTVVIDAGGRYVTPGLIDPHFHAYHAQQNMTQFAKLMLPRGTTTIADGLYGVGMISVEAIRFFIEEAKATPLKSLFMVPTISYFQNAELGLPKIFDGVGVDDMFDMLEWPECYGLEEPPAAVLVRPEDYPEMVELFAETLRRGKVIAGHAAAASGSELDAYIGAGANADHEAETTDEGIERARRGMWVAMLEGSGAPEVRRIVKGVTEAHLDSRRYTFAVDLASPLRLIEHGHIDECLRVAIGAGLDPVRAVQMATLNAAESLGVASDLGGVGPGKFADILLVDDLPSFQVSTVIANGKVVARDGVCTAQLAAPSYPEWLGDTVRVRNPLRPSDFQVEVNGRSSDARVRVIDVAGDSMWMHEWQATLPVSEGTVAADPQSDVLKIALIESHNLSGQIGKAFVRGFGLKRGAIASTHNSFFHGVNVVGTNDADMALAANTLIAAGGGEVVVCDGKVVALFELPLCGVLSGDPLDVALEKSRAVAEATAKMGCSFPDPFRSLAFTTACGNLGELKLSEKGLVNVAKREVVPLFVD